VQISFFFFGLHPKNKKIFPVLGRAQNENLFFDLMLTGLFFYGILSREEKSRE